MLEEAGFIDTVLESDDLLPGLRMQEVFEVLYSSGGCLEAFHKKQGSRNVRLTDWSEAGERSVQYTVALETPTIITNIIGTEVSIEESQRVTWTSISGERMPDPFTASTPGSAGVSSTSSKTSASDLPSEPPISFTVVCTPQLVPGGDRFFTELEFHFRKRAAGMGGGVRAMCSMKVETKVWGIQSTMEPWMMAEAKKNLTAFFPFMSEYFHMHSRAAMAPPALEPEVKTTPRVQPEGGIAAVLGRFSKEASEQSTFSSTRSSGEVFYDAEEVVPRGVRAAVQMFEGGNVGAGASKRPGFRSRSPSPQAKLTRLPLQSMLDVGTSNGTTPATPASPHTQPTPRSSRSPLTHEVHALHAPTAPSDTTTPDVTPRLEPTFTFRRKMYSKKGSKRDLDETVDRDRMDSARTVTHVIPPAATDTGASVGSEMVFTLSTLEPRFPGFDSDPPPHNASMFAMHSAHHAVPDTPEDTTPKKYVDKVPDTLAAGPATDCTWPQRSNSDNAVQTETALETLFHDAVSECRQTSGSNDSGSGSQLQSQCILYESVMPESVSGSTSMVNLQEERFRLSLERVSWKLGAAEQRIDQLSQRVRDCCALVNEVREGSELGAPAGSVDDVSRASTGAQGASGSLFGFGSRHVEGDSARSRMLSLRRSSVGAASVRSTASNAALATAGGFAVGVALGVSAVAGVMLLKPHL